MRDDFAVFILTHGRSGTISTTNSLKRSGYAGKLFYIVDNEDPTVDEYKRIYGDENVIVFDKESVWEKVDTMDNFKEKKAILYARHACFDIARDLGLKYFIQLDDDYTRFEHRWDNGAGTLKAVTMPDIENIFDLLINYMEKTGAMTIAFCQGGDFIGGVLDPNWGKGILRKAMNSFICRTDNPIDFRGTMNEDVTTYTTLGSRGKLFLSVTLTSIVQKSSQTVKGGMTEVYKDGGTYLKSFYSVISQPSSVKVSILYSKHWRIHHKIYWDRTVPKILHEITKKVE